MKTYGAVDLKGLTGATAATRWVGGTTSGPPTTGTFAVGDYVVAQNGAVFICTSAGTPGTWLDMSSGRELGYAQVTSNLTTTAVSAATATDATGLIITVTVGTRPIVVEFWALVWAAIADRGVAVSIVEAAAGDANRTPVLALAVSTSSAASAINPCVNRVRLAPSAGSHTYKIQFNSTTGAATTATIGGAATFPAFIRAYNV